MHVANFPAASYPSKVSKNGGCIMILGMSLATFTLVHVIISLIAIVSGIIVMFGLPAPTGSRV